MSFRDELKSIQNDIDKPIPFDEQLHQRKINNMYEGIKNRIRQDARKEKSNTLAGSFLFLDPYFSIPCENPSYGFAHLCEVTKEKRFINIYVKASLTALGKRVINELIEKAKQDGIILEILLVEHMDFTKKPGQYRVWEYDVIKKWMSDSQYHRRFDDMNPNYRTNRVMRIRTPEPCQYYILYEVQL